ncbi:MAG: hypothetical protein COB85_04405 [Bacteroidetes bacterium]|nr:MAG: hypothetical protein COB85_04405 [Bacteroidota bacterium]
MIKIGKYVAIVSSVFLITILTVKSQEATQEKSTSPKSFKELFTEAGYHLEIQNYHLALPPYLILDSIDPGNANLAYRIGLCYLNSDNNKDKAIPFLEEAVKQTAKGYDDLAPTERNAPLKTYYALASAYHLTYQIDSAISTFKKYQSLLHSKHFMQESVSRQIEMCVYAKLQMSSPINVDIINLGETINSEYSDFCPIINADETILIFTSRREGGTSSKTDIDGRFFEDIYISYQDMGSWSNAVGIGTTINTMDHDAAVGLSADGQRMFIYKDDDGDGNIYQSYLVGDTWTVPEILSNSINSPGWETHASVSSDGNILYFVSDREGGYGGRDIYRCKKLPNGEWAKAENLGDKINTADDEDAPYIHPNGTLLFFSSLGHNSMGGYDIFFSELLEDDTWIDPMNIGYPINTTHDDIFYIPSSDGKRAYYSSIDTSGYGEHDIHMAVFKDYEEIAVTVLKGIMLVTDIEGVSMDANITVYDNSDMDSPPKIFKPNSITGKYIIVLAPDRDYTIFYSVEDSILQTEHIFIPEESAYQEIERTIGLKPFELSGFTFNDPSPPEESIPPVKAEVHEDEKVKETADSYTSKGVAPYQRFFNYNIKTIDRSAKKYQDFLTSASIIIRKNGTLNIFIVGSASRVPTQKYGSNQTLALKRAESAKETLLTSFKELKIETENIHIEMKGLVQGPEYEDAAANNRLLFEKFQYVELRVN